MKYKTIKVPISNCKKCGKEMSRNYTAAQEHKLLYAHSWCSMADYCLECGDKEIEKKTRAGIRQYMGATVVEIKVERDTIRKLVLTTRKGKRIEVHSEGCASLRIREETP